ncbi:MAG: tRNA pseudouridine synthase A, partial [Clostridiales bacterium]|nr:tRNA pseudouridine synthase A [Clostridiales bacterium]
VHALYQVVHFDTDSPVPDDKFSYALNTMLPADIRVRASMAAAPDFHARFAAMGKIYRYAIHNAPHAPAIGRDHLAHAMYPLNEAAMDREAATALGRRDFAPFAASGSAAKDTVRNLMRARVLRRGERVTLWVYGDGFLYNMVRILAGTLIGVGGGKLPEGTIAAALLSGRRVDLGVTAPPGGLTLMRVFYDGDGDGGEYFDRLLQNEIEGW